MTRRQILGTLVLVVHMPLSAAARDWQACREAVAVAEREAGLPPGLLQAIARTESGRRDPATGRVEPWPWALNAAGMGLHAASRAEAVAMVAALQARGVRSIDTGCLQVNLLHHPNAFATVEEAFEPLANAHYAARFLRALQARAGGDWGRAVGWYHSVRPERGEPYRLRVMASFGGATMPAVGPVTAPAWPGPMPIRIPVFVPQGLAQPRPPMGFALPARSGLPRVITPRDG